MSDLRQHDDVGARALELAILCASRRSEVLEARWSELEQQERLWVIPAERMKGPKEHRVPLSGCGAGDPGEAEDDPEQRLRLRRTRHRACS